MPPQGPGMVGALPRPAWGAVAGMLSSPEDSPEKAWRATVLELRRTCKALAELVGAGCVGGAGRLEVETTVKAAQLEAAGTASLGRALVVKVKEPFGVKQEELALARALALAVERGHMICFLAPYCESPTTVRIIEATLIEASREGLLLFVYFSKGASFCWNFDAMAQLSVVYMDAPEREAIATLVGAGTLQHISLWYAKWADMSILSSLREVKLVDCSVEDLSPLADVPRLVVSWCRNIKALPAMRNDVLEVDTCPSLTDVSGLAGGRVGRLKLRNLPGVEDVSAIGAMLPPPRTVILKDMSNKVQDKSILAAIHRIEGIKCRKLDKAATLAALEGKVGTILWQE